MNNSQIQSYLSQGYEQGKIEIAECCSPSFIIKNTIMDILYKKESKYSDTIICVNLLLGVEFYSNINSLIV